MGRSINQLYQYSEPCSMEDVQTELPCWKDTISAQRLAHENLQREWLATLSETPVAQDADVTVEAFIRTNASDDAEAEQCRHPSQPLQQHDRLQSLECPDHLMVGDSLTITSPLPVLSARSSAARQLEQQAERDAMDNTTRSDDSATPLSPSAGVFHQNTLPINLELPLNARRTPMRSVSTTSIASADPQTISDMLRNLTASWQTTEFHVNREDDTLLGRRRASQVAH